jgi:hypothetical protein
MALGEWLSVQSSRELNQRQIDLEELASPKKRKKNWFYCIKPKE